MLVRTLVAAAALCGLAGGSAAIAARAAAPARPQAACPKSDSGAKPRRSAAACAGCNEAAPQQSGQNAERDAAPPFYCYRPFILAGRESWGG